MDQGATGCSVRALRQKITAKFGSNLIILVMEKGLDGPIVNHSASADPDNQ